MKFHTIKPKLALLLLLSFLLSTAFTNENIDFSAQPDTPPRWEKLGQRKIKRSLDRDEILVTARDGRFSKIKLMVRKSDINMHRCVIHFANGGSQEVQLRENMRAGTSSRVIDIDGGRRVIRKVVFWYDTKGLQDKAILELWGRH